jgi:hypothetical protein
MTLLLSYYGEKHPKNGTLEASSSSPGSVGPLSLRMKYKYKPTVFNNSKIV